MKPVKIIIALLLSSTLFACDSFSEYSKEDVVYKIQGTDNDPKDINILVNRLSSYQTSWFSSVTYEQASAEIIFKHGAPDEEVIKFMSQTLGVLSFYGEEDPNIVVSNEHIIQVEAYISADNVSILFGLNDDGEQLMNQITNKHIGKEMLVKLDGNILIQTKLTAVLGKHFEIVINISAEEATRTAALLRNGNLGRPISLKKSKT